MKLRLRTGERLASMAVPAVIATEPLCHNPRVYQGDQGTRIIVSDDDNTVSGVREHHVSVSNGARQLTTADINAVIALFCPGNVALSLVRGEKPGVWHIWPKQEAAR